jgi:hypothetical protein
VVASIDEAVALAGLDNNNNNIVCPLCATELQRAYSERHRAPDNDDDLFASARTEASETIDAGRDKPRHGRLCSTFGRLLASLTRRQQA